MYRLNYSLRAILIILLCTGSFAYAQKQKTLLFIGSYTLGRPDLGIDVYEMNQQSGELKKLSSSAQVTNPSFLTISQDGRFLYACTETKMPGAGSVSAFKIDSIAGTITLLNKQPAGGENPVYVTASRSGDCVINVNYTSGTASVFKTNSDGSLKPYCQLLKFSGSSINAERQDQPHLHAAMLAPDEAYCFLTDLGADKIRTFHFDPAKAETLVEEKTADVNAVPGSGPRHLAFHPNKKFLYCVEELSGTVAVYAYHDGRLNPLQRLPSYSKKQEHYESADIHLSPDGLFLYASNRSDDETLSIFSIDGITGKLTLIGHQSTYGRHPRNFAITSNGNFLLVANVNTGNIVIFKRDATTGLLSKLPQEIQIMSPSCLQLRTYHLPAHDK